MVATLADRSEGEALRAQMASLASILVNLDRRQAPADVLHELRARVEALRESGPESELLAACRELSALERAAIEPVDWLAVSGV